MLKKFKILNLNDSRQTEEQVDMLINQDHIISIKPIRIANARREVIEGYWIRLTNGKKYKAVSIPDSIAEVFKEDLKAPRINTFESEFQIQ